jgi:hypothetical protein
VDIFFPYVKGMTLETELLFRDEKTVAAPVMASPALFRSIGPVLLVDAGLSQPLSFFHFGHFGLFLLRVWHAIEEKTEHFVLRLCLGGTASVKYGEKYQ